MLFGKKNTQSKIQVTNQSKNTSVVHEPSESKFKNLQDHVLELENKVNKVLRPISATIASEDSEVRAIIRETRKAYGLWCIYVRKYYLEYAYTGTELDTNLTLEEQIIRMDDLINRAVSNLLNHSVGVRYKNNYLMDDESFVYQSIDKLTIENLNSYCRDQIVPALKNIGVSFDDFVTEFNYEIANKYFEWLLHCNFAGSYLVLKKVWIRNWYVWDFDVAYSSIGVAYRIKSILSGLHWTDKNFLFEICKSNRETDPLDFSFCIGITCKEVADHTEFAIGLSNASHGWDGDLVIKKMDFYSTPQSITLDVADEEFIALAQKIINDKHSYDEEHKLTYFPSDFDDEYK